MRKNDVRGPGRRGGTKGRVRALSHPDAYPISFVTLGRLRQVRPIVAAFLSYLTGPRATDSFRQRGMLLVKEAWPAPPGPPDDLFGPPPPE